MFRIVLVAAVLVGSSAVAWAADAPALTLHSAGGTVVKANASTVIFRPRQPDGTFGKAISLKLRGTSKATVISVQSRNEKLVLVQRETECKDLEPNQAIAVIYIYLEREPVLLSAVVQPAGQR